MEKYIDYRVSSISLSDIKKHFKVLSEREGETVFGVDIGPLKFQIFGFITNDEVKIHRKRFINKENELETYRYNPSKPYGEIFYLKNGKPELLLNYKNGQLDSAETMAPSYEIFNENGSEKLWYVRGENKTHLVRNFCRENQINEETIGQDEIELIMINISK